MSYVIDRIEGSVAVCECPDRSMIEISVSELPEGAKEGSKIERKEDRYVLVDNSADRDRIRKKLDSLFK